MTELWKMTLREYEEEFFQMALRSNPEGHLTRREYRSWYKDGCRLTEWLQDVELAVLQHETIPPRVLDDVFKRDDRQGRTLLKLMNAYGTTPEGYLPPKTRKLNREHRRAMIEARRKGRENGGTT